MRCLHPSHGFYPQQEGSAVCSWSMTAPGPFLCCSLFFISSLCWFSHWRPIFHLLEILTTTSSPNHGEWRERLSLPVYKQRKVLPGQLLFHLLVNAINIPNCFSRQKCKENIFPTAEDMKGRIRNMKKCLELLHCFRHKMFVSTYFAMYRVSLCHCFQAFPLILFMVQKQIN